MPNRILSPQELIKANALLEHLRSRLLELAAGDAELLFAYRRKVAKELIYDERSKPMQRKQLKAAKLRDQNGTCAKCGEVLPPKYNVLDRIKASDGYTAANTTLICQGCDQRTQAERGYA